MPRKQSNSAPAKTQQTQSTKPAATIRHGNLKATIWRNEGEKADWYNISLVRIFKDQNGFHETNQFNANDLLRVSFLAQTAYEKVLDLKFHDNSQDEGYDDFTKAEDLKDLQQFTGSEQFYKNPMFKHVVFTDGISYLREKGQCHWLIDDISIHLMSKQFKQAANDERISLLHFWKLVVNQDHSAVLKAVADSDEEPFISQEIKYTDFPLPDITIWAGINELGGYTLMLPSEY